MATLEELLDRIRDIARREQRPVEDVLAAMLRSYDAKREAAADAPPSPPTADDYEAALQALRPKLYEKARRYWQQVGDQERLSLTDEQLDEQFWLFDQDGIPRLKSDRDLIQLPPDPLESIVGTLDTDLTDLSTSIRETLKETTHPRYGWTKRGRTD